MEPGPVLGLKFAQALHDDGVALRDYPYGAEDGDDNEQRQQQQNEDRDNSEIVHAKYLLV